jgi:hypothetical protein
MLVVPPHCPCSGCRYSVCTDRYITDSSDTLEPISPVVRNAPAGETVYIYGATLGLVDFDALKSFEQ